jgi:hypothetical protein
MYFNYNLLKSDVMYWLEISIFFQFRPMLPSEYFDYYIPDCRGHIEAVCIEHVRLIPPPCSQYAHVWRKSLSFDLYLTRHRRQPTLSHVTSDQCTHSYWKYTFRYLRCIHITKQPFRVHNCTNNNDTTTALHNYWSNLDQTWSNLMKPRRITTSRQNSVSTPPKADVIPLYWRHLTWRGTTSRQRNVYPP